MSYYFNKIAALDFDEAVRRTTEALKQEGFGVLTDIDVQETLRKKLGVGFRRYRILGACNPTFAYEALQRENKIGTMLPCNVVLQETEDHRVDIAAIDPVASMMAIDNPALERTAQEVRARLQRVIASL